LEGFSGTLIDPNTVQQHREYRDPFSRAVRRSDDGLEQL
jgi:hypothetical protein